jgi:hypothetical protein
VPSSPLQNSILHTRITASKLNIDSAIKLGTIAEPLHSIEARAAKKLYEDIFRADQIGSRIENDRFEASRRVGNRKNLIMTEYIRMRKEAVQKLRQGL